MVLFVTKNADTFNNPTLFGLFGILEKHKKKSILLCTKNYFSLNLLHNQVIVYPEKKPPFRRNIIKYSISILEYLKQKKQVAKYSKSVTTIIGIDPEGIIWASELQKKYFPQAFLDFFSFEIFTEKYYDRKKLEIEACKKLRNVIVQDFSRKEFLEKVNLLSSNIKYYLIPVSTPKSNVTNTKKHTDVRKKFGIDSSKKLLVNFGSYSAWAGGEIIYQLIAQNKLPSNYIIVIHSRFQLNEEVPLHKKTLELMKHNSNIIVTTDYIESFDDTIAYLQQFDMGLAIYVPTFEDKYVGDNLVNMGLSSGKFSQYMKAGLPTITSNVGLYQQLNSKYNFGFTIENVDELSTILSTEINLNTLKKNALKLFDEKLDPTELLTEYVTQNLN